MVCNFTQSQVLADTADFEPNPIAMAIHIDQDRLIDKVLDLECEYEGLRRVGDSEVAKWRSNYQRAMWFACFGWCIAFWSVVGPWIWSLFRGLVWGS